MGSAQQVFFHYGKLFEPANVNLFTVLLKKIANYVVIIRQAKSVARSPNDIVPVELLTTIKSWVPLKLLNLIFVLP